MRFGFSYSFDGIFVLVLTFLYVNMVRLMTTLRKSVFESKNAVSVTYFCCSTIPKTGYTSVHSTWSSMQNVTVQFQKYPPRDTLVLFRFLAVRSPYSENNVST